MALKDIIASLDEEAKLQRDEIIARAKKSAAQIFRDTKSEAHQLSEDQQKLLIEQARNEEDQIIHQAQFDGKIELSRVRGSLVAGVWDAAEKRLVEIAQSEDYDDIFRALLIESWEAADGIDGERILMVNEGDVERANAILDDLSLVAKVVVADRLKGGGLILTSADGKHRLVNTLSNRLDRALPFLESRLRRLFS